MGQEGHLSTGGHEHGGSEKKCAACGGDAVLQWLEGPVEGERSDTPDLFPPLAAAAATWADGPVLLEGDDWGLWRHRMGAQWWKIVYRRDTCFLRPGALLDRCTAGVDLVGPILDGLQGAWRLELGP